MNISSKIPEIKIGYIYTRVSTYKQVSEGCSLEAQKNACERKAEELGIRIVHTFSDEGVSGRNFDRKGLTKLRNIVRNGEYIVTYSLSRLGRRTSETTRLYEEMQSINVQIISINEPFINDPRFGKFVATLMASINEMEVDETIRRTENVINEKKKNGEQTGPVGYGFDIHYSGGRKYLFPIAKEQMGITYAINNRSCDPPKTLGSLVKEMPGYGWTPKRSKKWTHSTLLRLVEGNIKKRSEYDFDSLTPADLEFYEKHRIPINLPKNKIVIDQRTGFLDYRKVYGLRYDKEINEIPSPLDIKNATENGQLTLTDEQNKIFRKIGKDEGWIGWEEEGGDVGETDFNDEDFEYKSSGDEMDKVEKPDEPIPPPMTPEMQAYFMKLMSSGKIPMPN